ncbi:hypothetical protein LPJ68_005065 [Coemansia sp. RSA 1086]|nr:hypothetical protein LPJ68_005065 [Coemansia sp. RSA 1086]
MFPKVTSLKFSGTPFYPAVDALYSHIAQQYAHQLQYLDSSHPISSERKFEMLKHASINGIGVSNYKVPQMSAECLEKLSLYNVPSDFSWNSFEGSEFSNLYELCVYYTAASNGNQRIPARRLLFPKLKVLDVDGISNEYPVFHQAVFPEEISRLFISGFGDMYRSIRDIKLPRAKKLGISTSLDHDDTSQTVSYMNQIAKNAARAETVYFRVYNNVPVAAGDVTCTAITVLYLKTQISIETMLSLIGTLHNLVDLELGRLIGGDSTVQYVDLPESDEQLLEPFNSKLKCLALKVEDQPEASSNIVDVVIFILLKLPMLRELMCEQLAKAFLNKLELYVEAYPKLQTIAYGISQDAIDNNE